MKKILYIAIAILSLAACGKKEKIVIELNSVEFENSGPFNAESSETFSKEVKTEIQKLLADNKITVENIATVRITKAEFKTKDSNKFSDFSSISVSMVGAGETKMQDVGSLNPLKENSAEQSMSTSLEANLSEIFKSKEITLVCNLNGNKEREKAMSFYGNFSFEIEVKK